MKKIILALMLSCMVLSSAPVLAKTKKDKIKTASETTYDVERSYLDNGAIVHVARWNICTVVTWIGNSPNIGSQVFMFDNGSTVIENSVYVSYGTYCVNTYSWGTVTSSDEKQIITRYNVDN